MRSVCLAAVLSLSACDVRDDAPYLPDGGCPGGFVDIQDHTCSAPYTCTLVGDGGCLRACTTDKYCHSPNICSNKGFFWGGDFICNRTELVCRPEPDDCPRKPQP